MASFFVLVLSLDLTLYLFCTSGGVVLLERLSGAQFSLHVLLVSVTIVLLQSGHSIGISGFSNFPS